MSEEQRLRQLLSAPRPSADLERRILEGLPPARSWRHWWGIAASVALMLAVFWPTLGDPLAPFIAHAHAEQGLEGRLAESPRMAGVVLVKHCRVAGRPYLHLRWSTPAGPLDAFYAPELPALPPRGEHGGRAWTVAGLPEGAVLAIHPPGIDPLPWIRKINLKEDT